MEGRMHMRRKDREITDKKEIEAIIDKARSINLALNTDSYPYIIPLSYGWSWEDSLCFYFHCAKEGRKIDLIAKNNKAGFELDTNHELVTGETDCDWGYKYASIIGTACVNEVFGEEKMKGLRCLMAHYGKTSNHVFLPQVVESTRVFKIEVMSMSAKSKK
ncbi:MAG TPA: pyridoxamine 5'-phosphate oxidase family protein [Treponemataceae bacterium]|nr:pyridoxamine 5'-phosphate oxidase family protein [Treponemataceae bacterium]